MDMSTDKADVINRAAIEWLNQFSPYGVITTDTSLVVTGWNQWMVLNSKKKETSVLAHGLLSIYPDLVERKMDRYYQGALQGRTSVLSHRLHDYLIPIELFPVSDGYRSMPQSATISPLNHNGKIAGTLTYIEDVRERVLRERELKDRIAALEDALEQVNTLKGLIPICSYCKNIRDDKGYWNKLEEYIGKHSNVDFSHGICPECAEKYFPDMDLYGEDD